MSTCDGKREMRQTGLVKTVCGCCRCPQLRDRRFPQGRDDTRQYSADGGLAWRAVAKSRAAAAPRAKKVFSSTRRRPSSPAHKKDRPKAALAIPRYSLAGAVCSPRRLSCRRTKTARKDHALHTLHFTKNTTIINTINRRDCLHRFDTPSFGDRRQGLPPRSPDRFHPSEKSALERGWGELEGGRGKPCARAKVSPFPPHHKQALRPASPDAR